MLQENNSWKIFVARFLLKENKITMEDINKVDDDELNKDEQDVTGKQPNKYVKVPKNLEDNEDRSV